MPTQPNTLPESLAAELASLKRRLDEKETENIRLRNELQNAQKRLGELEARTQELKAAQVYHTKVDMLSGAEVISLINALNAEILQTAALISDSFDFTRHLLNTDEMVEARSVITKFIGPTLAHLLGTVSHNEDPLLVQIALQGAAVELSRGIIETWDFGLTGCQHAKHSLLDIYKNLRKSETQAMCGRWRALTRTYAQRVVHQEADVHLTAVAQISDTLANVLVAAGCTKSYEEANQTFSPKFGERISNIVKMAACLNEGMSEVISADLWPFHVAPGREFNPATMSDFESPTEGSEGKTILCTTALGLMRSEKVMQDGVAKFKKRILLKPTVALESVVDILERYEA